MLLLKPNDLILLSLENFCNRFKMSALNLNYTELLLKN